MSLEMYHYFYALRFVTDVVLNILLCSADFTRVDGSTILEV